MIGQKTNQSGELVGGDFRNYIAKGFPIDRKNISIKEELIKEVGSYTAKIKLHRDVFVDVEFEIVSE